MAGTPDDMAAKLQTLATRLLRRARTADARSGLGSAQYSAMAALRAEAPLSLAALARREAVSHVTMSRVVASLVEAGLVRREPDPADRRSRLLSLTPEGRATYERISARRTQTVAAVLRLLRPETAAELVAALETVAARLERD
ncbi:MAG TPA: MarR family transcriptional regulator [Allosphingosinicella sp.]|nr:MarR family transcriptional regulator [Allosphingosinicella sp.]